MMKTDSVSSNPRRIFAAVILAAGSLCLLYAAQNIPAFADWYTAHVYSILVETIGRFWGIFPFSAVEFGLYLTILVLILSLIYAIHKKRPAATPFFFGYFQLIIRPSKSSSYFLNAASFHINSFLKFLIVVSLSM